MARMTTTSTVSDLPVSQPVGRFAGRRLRELTDSYLAWAAGVLRAGTPVYAAVAGELQRRRVPVPEPPPPRQPTCGKCGPGAGFTVRPSKDSLDREHLRTWGDGCGASSGNVPRMPVFLVMAAAKQDA
jgi:hypothetical protein